MTTENVTTGVVFADRHFLAPDYLPGERLVDREVELANVEYAVNPMIFGREPDNLLVHGPRGVGKSTCVRYSARRQTRYASEQGITAGRAYVDCLAASTDTKASKAIATQLNDSTVTGVEIPDSGLSTTEYHDRLLTVLDRRYDAAVFVLDRIDWLKAGRLPLVFEDGPESCIVGVIGIVDGDPDSSPLGTEVRGVLGTEYRFDPYDVDQLVDILERRRDAFVDGALETGALLRAAELAGDPYGDAERAIAMLRLAGDAVRDRGDASVGPVDVEAAADGVASVRTRDVLTALADHARLVVLALASLTEDADTDALRTMRVYSAYIDLCRRRGERPRSERRVQGFLNDLAGLGLTEQATHWGGRADGNYKTHRLSQSPDVVFRALDDPSR